MSEPEAANFKEASQPVQSWLKGQDANKTAVDRRRVWLDKEPFWGWNGTVCILTRVIDT